MELCWSIFDGTEALSQVPIPHLLLSPTSFKLIFPAFFQDNFSSFALRKMEARRRECLHASIIKLIKTISIYVFIFLSVTRYTLDSFLRQKTHLWFLSLSFFISLQNLPFFLLALPPSFLSIESFSSTCILT